MTYTFGLDTFGDCNAGADGKPTDRAPRSPPGAG